jgi:hypothetical protein
MVIRFLSKFRQHTSICNWVTRRLGVWSVVLLIHFFLWIALDKKRDVSPPRRNLPNYLSVVSIAPKTPPVGVPQFVKNSLEDISKRKTISSKKIIRTQQTGRDIDVSEQKIVIPEDHINQQRSAELLDPRKNSEFQESFPQAVYDGSSKQIKTLDYDEMKAAALSVTREKKRRLLPGADERITGAQKFTDAIDHAKRGDCRTKHAHLGILAIPFLLKDTITDEGCKW